jgi:hypothetical protein
VRGRDDTIRDLNFIALLNIPEDFGLQVRELTNP